MRESIFSSSIRAFFIAFFSIIGLFLGIIPILLIFGSMSTTTEVENKTVYTPEIVPNAEGVRKILSSDAPIILKINIDGIIGTDSLNMSTIRTQLVESREGSFKSDRVKAILLYINSPGGTVIDADGIYRALKAYKEKYKTPIYAYVDGLCASGGMYIAAAADKIMASDVSLVGSIGVLSPSFFNVYQMLEKIGVQSLTLYAGKGKEDLNPLRPWRKDEDESYKKIIEYYYNDFVNIMVSNRPSLNKTKLIQDYGAHIFPAKEGQEFGYVDEIGVSLDGTIKMLAKHIGIEDDFYQVMQLEKKNWYTDLFKSSFSALKGETIHKIEFPGELDSRLMNKFLYLYKP